MRSARLVACVCVMTLAGLLLVFSSIGCGGGGGGPSVGAEPAQLAVTPGEAAPGEAVRVVLQDASCTIDAQTVVRVGDRAAALRALVSATACEVLAFGVAAIVMRGGGEAR